MKKYCISRNNLKNKDREEGAFIGPKEFVLYMMIYMRHIVSPCNKAGISKFHLEFWKFQELQIYLKSYSSFSSFSVILNFFAWETCYIVTPCNIAGISDFRLEFHISLKRYSSFSSYSIILIFFLTRETIHLVLATL